MMLDFPQNAANITPVAANSAAGVRSPLEIKVPRAPTKSVFFYVRVMVDWVEAFRRAGFLDTSTSNSTRSITNRLEAFGDGFRPLIKEGISMPKSKDVIDVKPHELTVIQGGKAAEDTEYTSEEKAFIQASSAHRRAMRIAKELEHDELNACLAAMLPCLFDKMLEVV